MGFPFLAFAANYRPPWLRCNPGLSRSLKSPLTPRPQPF